MIKHIFCIKHIIIIIIEYNDDKVRKGQERVIIIGKYATKKNG